MTRREVQSEHNSKMLCMFSHNELPSSCMESSGHALPAVMVL